MSDERTTPYTTKELAEAAGVSDRYVRQLVTDGKLAGQKVGRDWIIPAEEGRAWLQERRARWEKF